MSKECIGYNDITKQFIYRDEETGFSLNARFDMKPEETKINIWGYELCNGAEWNDFLDVVNKLGKDKADLEAKLAECEEQLLQKERKIEDLMLCEFVATTLDFNKLSADNCRLREQLAEKELELERIKDIHIYDKTIEIFTKALAMKNQDKISFAVEQLTEIRDYVKECWSLDTTEGKVRLDIAKKIRLKIEQLTHQHEDKGE